MSTELADQTEKKSAVAQMAGRLAISQPRLMEVLKATVFKACKDDNQFAALVIVANEYQLNPLTKEIYAFPGKGGEIVPIVSIDGWLRIINSHAQFDGMDEEFAPDGAWCKVTMFRKDRTRPTVHTEFLDEVRRNTEPWKQHTRRMLKWKTIIQCARIAFGFGGIYDEDEGKEVVGMRDVTPERKTPTENPFKRESPPENDQPAKEQAEEDPESLTLDGDANVLRGYYESHITQESKPGAAKPWKLWRLNFIVNGSEKKAVTFSETIGAEIEWLEDGDAFLIEVEESPKGDVIKMLKREEAGE